MRRAALPLIAGAAALSFAAYVAMRSYDWFEPAAFFYPVIGVDVSHHQGLIDWRELAKSKTASFAYIKASEGGDHRDKRFAENWQAARNAGILRGAYHFFTLCRRGIEQAENFIAAVPLDEDALPPAIDVEHMGTCRSGLPIADVRHEITVFLDRVEGRYGRRPLIYTTREFHDAHLDGHFLHERFWVRSLVLPPRYRRTQWTIWQYHNHGRRAGIDGPVDLNAFSGGKEAFSRFARPSSR